MEVIGMGCSVGNKHKTQRGALKPVAQIFKIFRCRRRSLLLDSIIVRERRAASLKGEVHARRHVVRIGILTREAIATSRHLAIRRRNSTEDFAGISR
jgi:hypothetical protein